MRDVLLALFCALAAAGCSYDWAVAPGGAAADAASDVAPQADATPTDGTTAPDAPADASAPDALPDVVVEAAPLPGCTASQEMAVQQARAAALVCTGITPNPCRVMVTDECGCLVYAAADNQAEANYVAAIEQLRTSCIPLCPTGCGTAPSPGVCILSDAGAGALACYQQG
jgi:hypothetical protein